MVQEKTKPSMRFAFASPRALHLGLHGTLGIRVEKGSTMINQIILTVSDVERLLAFYEAALKPLNIKYFLPYKGKDGHPDLWGFGDGKRAFFWLKQGKADPAAIHWGFDAKSNENVDEFYRAAMAAGARNNISPRARLEYYPGYYAADVFDPDGYSFEVVYKS
jgi:catechol 2,3-dioxygenase-like lactoylglutathione lyase family enzyme